MKKITLFLGLLLTTFSLKAQTIIYQQNFDGNNGTFPNTIVSQMTPLNGWLANNTDVQIEDTYYRHLWNFSNVQNPLNPHCDPISGRSLGVGFYNGNDPNVENQYFRIWDGEDCDVMPLTTRWAHVGFSTVGYENITIEFKWRCSGDVEDETVYDYGTVNTSIDGGSTWLMDTTSGQAGTTGSHGTFAGGLYYNNTGVQTATITLPSTRDNQPNFRVAFRMVIDECYGTGGGFIVDDIVVRGTAISSSVSNFNIDENWIVYSTENQIKLESRGFDIKNVAVYDLTGREIYRKEGVDSNTFEMDKFNATQVLMIKIVSSDNKTSVKKVQN